MTIQTKIEPTGEKKRKIIFFWWVVVSNRFVCIFELLNQKTMKNKMNEQVKFARWVLIHTDEAKHTAGVCRFYKNKLYTIDEIFDIYTNIQSKSENAELTPHIEYYDNGNVWVKGQKNSKGQQEGLWELFYPNGNICLRTPYKEGKRDGIQEDFDGHGNIIETTLWKNGEVIEETKH
jgi:antitoxin component YwqK of YwqJK toxin-antitoxin module